MFLYLFEVDSSEIGQEEENESVENNEENDNDDHSGDEANNIITDAANLETNTIKQRSKSTKQPLTTPTSRKPRKLAEEDKLLEKAFMCMENISTARS